MSIESITAKIKDKIAMASSLNAKIKFDFGDNGLLFVDATTSPPTISHNDDEADLVLICTADVMSGILNGTQDPNMAFMMGKLKVKGSMGLAMKLNGILED